MKSSKIKNRREDNSWERPTKESVSGRLVGEIKQEGVENASVNLAAATLAVTYNPDIVSPQQLKEAVMSQSILLKKILRRLKSL